MIWPFMQTESTKNRRKRTKTPDFVPFARQSGDDCRTMLDWNNLIKLRDAVERGFDDVCNFLKFMLLRVLFG